MEQKSAKTFPDQPSATLTKREYFAAHIFPALIEANSNLLEFTVAKEARLAVLRADALISALNNEEES